MSLDSVITVFRQSPKCRRWNTTFPSLNSSSVSEKDLFLCLHKNPDSCVNIVVVDAGDRANYMRLAEEVRLSANREHVTLWVPKKPPCMRSTLGVGMYGVRYFYLITPDILDEFCDAVAKRRQQVSLGRCCSCPSAISSSYSSR